MPGGGGTEGRQWVIAFDHALLQVIRAGTAEDHGAAARGTNEKKPDAGVRAERGDEFGIGLVDLLQGQAARPAREVDQAQTARAHDHDLDWLRGRAAGAAP